MSGAPVGIGIVGMGFMGQTHARSYLSAIDAGDPGVLVAVCDADADRRAGIAAGTGNMGDETEQLFDPDEVTGYDDADALLADDRIGLVSICTPTDTHADLAIRALRAGKHVLVEKPVAIRADEIERLMDVAARAGRLCVPAMCVRHWPGWSGLPAIIASGEHGRVVHARFERLGSRPTWGAEFYNDTNRSGGAIFDLHVHDADMALWLFGKPVSVSSVGDDHHVSTQYRFEGGAAVIAEGGWMNDASFPFRMRFTIEFERAVLTFDSLDDEPYTLHASGGVTKPAIAGGSGYEHQAVAMVRAAAGGDAGGLPTLQEALDVTRLIRSEQDSAIGARDIRVDW